MDQKHVKDSIAVIDEQVARGADSIGGLEFLLSLGCTTVMSLDDVSTPAAAAEWHGVFSPMPVKLLIVVGGEIQNCENRIVDLLRAPYKSSPIRANVYWCSGGSCNIEEMAVSLMFKAKPNVVEIQVLPLPWNLKVHLNDSPSTVGMFSLVADLRTQNLFPLTLSRIGRFSLLKDVDDIDANEVLSAIQKNDLKRTASILCSVFVHQLKLDVSGNCWAQGFTARIIGNALLGYIPSDLKLPPAKLILIDRTLDLPSALRHGNIMHEILQLDPQMNSKLSRYLGNIPGEHSYASIPLINSIAAELCTLAPEVAVRHACKKLNIDFQVGKTVEDSIDRLCSLLDKDSNWIRNIPSYQLVANLVLGHFSIIAGGAQKTVIENILFNTHHDQLFHVIIDLINRKQLSALGLLQLTLIACGCVGASSKNALEYEDICLRAVSDMLDNTTPDDPLWALIERDNAHIVQVLREVIHSNPSKHPGSYLSSVIKQAVLGGPTELIQLGETSLQQTAKDLEKTARSLFNAFGFGESKDDKLPFKLIAGDICVLFIVGGISYREIQQVISLADSTGVKFVLGGTKVCDDRHLIAELFQKDLDSNTTPKKATKNEFGSLF